MKLMGKWKLFGLLATIATASLSIVAGIIEDKKMEQTIEEKVDLALAERNGEES